MKLGIRTNVDQVLADIDAFEAKVRQVAVPRALNRLRDAARVAAARQIAEVYGLGVREIQASRYIRIELASPARPVASFSMGGPGFPLSLFRPLKVPGQGVSVLIKGRRVLIPHAFLATMRSGHLIVGARGAYGGKSGRALRRTGAFGRFVFGRGDRLKRANKWGVTELPINEFLGFSLGDALGNRLVEQATQQRVQELAADELRRQIRFAQSGA